MPEPLDPQAFRDHDWSLEQFERRQEQEMFEGRNPMFETDIDRANRRIQELEDVKLSPIQKEIEANNIEMGRKLLAYDVMLAALKQIAKPRGVWSNDRETFYKNIIDETIRIAEEAIAKATGETP